MKQQRTRVTPRHVIAVAAIALLVATVNSAFSQVWERKYGGTTSDEYGYSATPIKHDPGGAGGYVAVGRTNASGSEDVYLTKVDNNGTTLWQKSYDFGGGTNDVALSLYECVNGDLLVAGTTGDQPSAGICNRLGTDNIFLIRLEADGDLLWARTFGGIDEEGDGAVTNLKVIETTVSPSAGDIVIATSTESFGNGSSRTGTWFPDAQILSNRDGFLIRTDASGNLRWARAYGVPAPNPTCYNCPQVGTEDYFTAVAEAMNGDLIAAGVTHDPTGTQQLPWIVRTDAAGMVGTSATTFIKVYKIIDAALNVLNTRIYAVRECPSLQNYQDILLTGACDTKEATGATNTELYLFATTNGGLPLANLTCGDYGTGTTGLDEGRDVIETSAARFVAVGTTTNLGAPGRGTAVYAIQVNKATNASPPPLDVMTKMWSRTYGDAWGDQGWGVAEVDNSGSFGTPGLFLVGSSFTNAFGRNDWQKYLLKVFGTNGATECSYEPSEQFTVPDMTTVTYNYQSCKVRVQANRVPELTVRNWNFDPICND